MNNHLPELKHILDIMAQQKQRAHVEVNFDGTLFHWGITLGSVSASQLDALFTSTCDPVADSPVLPLADSSIMVHKREDSGHGA